MCAGSNPSSQMRNLDLRCSDSLAFVSTAGALETAMATSASVHLNVFLKYSTLAGHPSKISSLPTDATACSACLNMTEPRGTPMSSAHVTIAWTSSGLAVIILGLEMHSLAISQSPNPHSRSNATLGLTTLSRLCEMRSQNFMARRRFSEERKRRRWYSSLETVSFLRNLWAASEARRAISERDRPRSESPATMGARVLSTLAQRSCGSLATTAAASAPERPRPARKASTASGLAGDLRRGSLREALTACARVRPQVEKR
ncbi:hypothetical protein VPH35_093171 [Triticum aestivum]